MVCLLTWQRWLKIGLTPTAVNLLAKMNGHQTLRTLTFWLSGLGSYAWTPQDISSQAKENWWTEESLAVNMGLAASGLNKQSHTEVHKKSSLCDRWDGHLECALRKIFNNVEHWTLHVTLHFFGIIVKYGIKYFKSCNSWSNENILAKFSRIVENSFCCKSQNFGKKILLVVEKLLCVKWDIFQPPSTHTGFCQTGQFFQSYCKLGQFQKVNFGNSCNRTGQISFLSSNKQHQSTEGWHTCTVHTPTHS